MIKLLANKLKGSVVIPPSKSLAHRALVLASMAKNEVRIDNISYSNDISATISCLENLGIKIEKYKDYVIVKPSKIRKINDINCGESGTTLRFMIPYALLQNEEIKIDGENRLKVRPINDYFPILDSMNVKYNYNDSLPISLKGSLKSGIYELSGNVSSQFISGMLLTLPFIDGDSKIIITTPLESKPYVDMTIKIAKDFGINIIEDKNTYLIKGNQEIKIDNYYVEGDYSQAAFFLVANAIGNELSLKGLKRSNMQGDEAIINILENLGIIFNSDYTCKVRNLHGGVISLAQNPDLAPILGVLASNIDGEVKLIDLERLAYKESNRILSTKEMLEACGVDVIATNNSLTIKGKTNYKTGHIKAYNDHRIVMASAILASLVHELYIDEIKPVNKSFPNFFNIYKEIGGEVDE